MPREASGIITAPGLSWLTLSYQQQEKFGCELQGALFSFTLITNMTGPEWENQKRKTLLLIDIPDNRQVEPIFGQAVSATVGNHAETMVSPK